MPRPRVIVAALVFVTYTALAFSLHNFYPVSTFEMYAAQRTDSASRVVARDAGGQVHELDRFDAWRCDGPISVEPAACPGQFPYSYTTYLDRAAVDFVGQHAGAGGEPVDVIRRVFRLSDQPQIAVEDCLLQHCRAVRR